MRFRKDKPAETFEKVAKAKPVPLKRGLGLRAAQGVARFHSVTALLDGLIRMHTPVSSLWLRRTRRVNPTASPQEVLEALNGYFKGTITASGMGIAAGFAAPGIAKVAVVALASGQVFTVAEASALYASTRAAIYGYEDKGLHRQLLLAALTGRSSLGQTQHVSEARLRHLLPALAAAIPAAELTKGTRGGFSSLTGRSLSKKLPKTLSKGVPFVAGAAIGGKMSAEAANQIIARMDLLFGPPPPWWPNQMDGVQAETVEENVRQSNSAAASAQQPSQGAP